MESNPPATNASAARVRRVDEVVEQPVPNATGTTRQVLLGPEETPHFAMRRFVMQPGGGMPRHVNTVEHEQYVLRGRARIGIGERAVDVQPGSVLYIPAGVPHWYRVEGEEPFEFLCLVPNLPDKVRLTEEKAES